MANTKLGRRAFLGTSAATVAALGAAPSHASKSSEEFTYEIQRSEAEWRDMLSDAEYEILRNAGTEEPKSNPLWDEKRPGLYRCRGCDLTLYKSLQKIDLDKGWAFFRHSFKDTVLLDLDLKGGRMGDPFAELGAAIEVHCRRCGSHLGHIVALPEVPNAPIHCINGTSLQFEQSAA